MSNDGGVWAKVQQGVATDGGGIYAKTADGWTEIGASEGGASGGGTGLQDVFFLMGG
jgi:hypothetical protein